MKLMIIDPDRPSLKALGETLNALGFENEAFYDPRQALIRFRASPDFDVVITDLRLPWFSGGRIIETFKQLRTDLPVIAITAYDDQKPAGAGRIFEKPLNIRQLIRHLDTLKPSSRRRSATMQA